MALKRQQATEDAIALGLRSVASGTRLSFLPPGPIFGSNGTGESPTEQQQQQLIAMNSDDDEQNAIESSARSCGDSPPSPEMISKSSLYQKCSNSYKKMFKLESNLDLPILDDCAKNLTARAAQSHNLW